ncbi:sulfotransferase family protein [Sulfurovum sp. NBC37-1]|uniref:sulfotransferase family protein n=1 Tax=Sulfurovum sp. (strain NBC37-1) TaxID=387093 RepID=UPI0001587B5E|nr:sulfotransferase [Sulfurovum sp. NBC37-1]BAF72483.1 sulfotransferase [Sulfurovum sp. NBC37-1]
MITQKPIFIFGTGRSGTTVFHEMLCEHPNLAWTSHFCNFFPAKPVVNRALMHAIDIPWLGKVLKKKIVPVETYRFWDHYFPGFSLPCRDLVASDASVRIKKRLNAPMSKLTTQKRDRIAHKITGWPRIGFLNEVFPDAKFIHVVRDGRAVANSMLNVDFWDGWEGPAKWIYGSLPKQYEKEWNSYNQSFVVLAALQWKMLMDAAAEALKQIDPSRVLEIRYEDMCPDPIPTFKKVAEFCDIPWDEKFEGKLKNYTMRNTNDKYKKDLTLQQQDMLNAVLHEYLHELGYSV